MVPVGTTVLDVKNICSQCNRANTSADPAGLIRTKLYLALGTCIKLSLCPEMVQVGTTVLDVKNNCSQCHRANTSADPAGLIRTKLYLALGTCIKFSLCSKAQNDLH